MTIANAEVGKLLTIMPGLGWNTERGDTRLTEVCVWEIPNQKNLGYYQSESIVMTRFRC